MPTQVVKAEEKLASSSPANVLFIAWKGNSPAPFVFLRTSRITAHCLARLSKSWALEAGLKN